MPDQPAERPDQSQEPRPDQRPDPADAPTAPLPPQPEPAPSTAAEPTRVESAAQEPAGTAASAQSPPPAAASAPPGPPPPPGYAYPPGQYPSPAARERWWRRARRSGWARPLSYVAIGLVGVLLGCVLGAGVMAVVDRHVGGDGGGFRGDGRGHHWRDGWGGPPVQPNPSPRYRR